MKVFDDAQKFTNLRIVKSKTRFIFNFTLDPSVIQQLIELGFSHSNIIIPGQSVTLLGQLCLIGDYKDYKGSIEQLKVKTVKIKEIIQVWEKRHLLPQGRRVIANSLLTSQISFLEYNSHGQRRISDQHKF